MASRNDSTETAAAAAEDEHILQTVGDLTIDTGTNVPTAVTVGSGVVAVTLAIQTPAGEVSVSLSQSDAEHLSGSLATSAAELDEAGAQRSQEWLQQYRSED